VSPFYQRGLLLLLGVKPLQDTECGQGDPLAQLPLVLSGERIETEFTYLADDETTASSSIEQF
jgi:hypothetical protein